MACAAGGGLRWQRLLHSPSLVIALADEEGREGAEVGNVAPEVAFTAADGTVAARLRGKFGSCPFGAAAVPPIAEAYSGL